MNYPAYPTYKESGIPWLGTVPEHWEVKASRYGFQIQLGKMLQPEAATNCDHELPYLKSQHVQWESVRTTDLPVMWASDFDEKKYGIKDGDLLVCEGGDVGRSAIVRNPPPHTIIQNALHRVRSHSNEPRFLMFILKHAASQNWFDILCNRSTIAHFTGEKFGALRIPLPPLSEQTAIADFLDRETGRIDTLIEKKRRLIGLLKEKRSALISRTVTRGMPAEAAREFGLEPHARFKDSGIAWLGEVPEGWMVKRIKHILQAKKGAIKTGPFGSQLQSGEMLEGDIKVYNQRSVIDRDLDSGENYISLDKFQRLSAFEVFPSDLLVTTRGTIGRCVILPENVQRGILHPCLMRLQLNQRLCSNRFIEIFIQESDKVLSQLRLMSNATTIDVIYSESLKEVWLALPPISEQTAIATYLDRETAKLDKLTSKVEQAIERLQEYRTALITAAVTGKIDVRYAAENAGQFGLAAEEEEVYG